MSSSQSSLLTALKRLITLFDKEVNEKVEKVSYEVMVRCFDKILKCESLAVNSNLFFARDSVSIETCYLKLNTLNGDDIRDNSSYIRRLLKTVFSVCVAQCLIHWPDKSTLRRFAIATVGYVYKQLKDDIVHTLAGTQPFDQINDLFTDGNPISIMYRNRVYTKQDVYNHTYGDGQM